MAKALYPDICVIGAGPGGLAVAAGAAAHGVKVVLVDKMAPGGRSALPYAALAAAARQAQTMRRGVEFGMAEVEPEIDFKTVMTGIRGVAAEAAPALSPERLATLGVTVIKAEARFAGRRKLLAGDTEIRARRYVLATGSRPIVPAIPGLEEIGCLTADTAFDLGRRPGHLIVIGGDATALELAQAFRRLGSQVTVIAGGTVLPGEDPEMAAVVARRLAAEGVAIMEDAKVAAVERRGKTSVRVVLEAGEGEEADAHEIDGSHLMVCAGRTPDVDGLDLKKARVALKGDVVDVSAMLRTTNRRIYAIGDVAGTSSAQAAAHQAELVLKGLLFRLPAKDRAIVPRVVNTDPGIAHVGLTEAQAAAKRHRRLTILRWPYAENGRARAERRTEGHIKLVVARNGDLLGVTVAGANAAETIVAWELALSKRLGLKDMASSIPPHPTTAEIGKSAAMAYFAGRARRPLIRGIVRLLQLFG
jgi:pyruvate/2-oxoglutarate dehydrogenase complex dihydrolipoamide dehydrogenase (E3) component